MKGSIANFYSLADGLIKALPKMFERTKSYKFMLILKDGEVEYTEEVPDYNILEKHDSLGVCVDFGWARDSFAWTDIPDCKMYTLFFAQLSQRKASIIWDKAQSVQMPDDAYLYFTLDSSYMLYGRKFKEIKEKK